MTEEKTDISLEERLAKRLAVRLPNYDDGRADTAVVRVALECALKDAGVRLCEPVKASVYVAPDTGGLPKFLEEAFKNAQPIGRVIAEESLAGLAEGVALGRLHLDHVGAEIGQQHRPHRAVHHLREIQNPDPVQSAGHVISPFRTFGRRAIGALAQPLTFIPPCGREVKRQKTLPGRKDMR